MLNMIFFSESVVLRSIIPVNSLTCQIPTNDPTSAPTAEPTLQPAGPPTAPPTLVSGPLVSLHGRSLLGRKRVSWQPHP
jgi:hypothetical protein